MDPVEVLVIAGGVVLFAKLLNQAITDEEARLRSGDYEHQPH